MALIFQIVFMAVIIMLLLRIESAILRYKEPHAKEDKGLEPTWRMQFKDEPEITELPDGMPELAAQAMTSDLRNPQARAAAYERSFQEKVKKELEAQRAG